MLPHKSSYIEEVKRNFEKFTKLIPGLQILAVSIDLRSSSGPPQLLASDVIIPTPNIDNQSQGINDRRWRLPTEKNTVHKPGKTR